MEKEAKAPKEPKELKKESELKLHAGVPVACKVWSMRIKNIDGTFKISEDERDRDIKYEQIVLEYSQIERLNKKSSELGEVYEVLEKESIEAQKENIASKKRLQEEQENKNKLREVLGKSL